MERCVACARLTQSQTEANDKVGALKKETEKALKTLAILHERFVQVNSDLADIDKKFDVKY